jgi:hypothetical protein
MAYLNSNLNRDTVTPAQATVTSALAGATLYCVLPQHRNWGASRHRHDGEPITSFDKIKPKGVSP